MPLLARLSLVAVLAAGLAACNKAQARTPQPPPEPPAPLEMPEPPGRLIIGQRAIVDPPAQPPPAPQTGTPPRPPRPTNAATPPPQTPPPVQASDPPPVVQTNQSSDQLEQQTRRQMASASSHLAGVDYGSLSSSGRSTYDEVRRFIRQAEEKLKIRNYVLAEELARKAVQLASQLVKRASEPAPPRPGKP